MSSYIAFSYNIISLLHALFSAIICEDYSPPSHANSSTADNVVGTQLLVWCDTGYVMTNSNKTQVTVKCSEEGAWQADMDIKCQGKSAPINTRH